MHVCMPSHFSCARLFATLWPVARQAPLSMGFSRQEYWSGLPFAPAGGLPDPGMEPRSPETPALMGGFSTTEPPGRPVWRAGFYLFTCLSLAARANLVA